MAECLITKNTQRSKYNSNRHIIVEAKSRFDEWFVKKRMTKDKAAASLERDERKGSFALVCHQIFPGEQASWLLGGQVCNAGGT